MVWLWHSYILYRINWKSVFNTICFCKMFLLFLILIRILTFSVNMVGAVTCPQLRSIYSASECCSSNNNALCLQEIPACTDASVVAGQVCLINGNAFVKGLSEAFDLSGSSIGLKKSIIPDTNAQFDLGSAEYKIRHLFLSDN